MSTLTDVIARAEERIRQIGMIPQHEGSVQAALLVLRVLREELDRDDGGWGSGR